MYLLLNCPVAGFVEMASPKLPEMDDYCAWRRVLMGA